MATTREPSVGPVPSAAARSTVLAMSWPGALTDLGQSLLPLVTAIKDWAETHIDEIQAARSRYTPT